MATLTQGSMNVLLISCVLSVGISVPSFAEDGVIVTGRNVQAHMYGRAAFGKDPYPTTANANPSRDIIGATGELSDMDIGGISSGSSIVRAVQTNGTLTGLHATQNSMSTLGAGSAAGHGAGSGMGGQISDSVQRGMAPLNNIGSMLGGK
ncbi:MULTISPECIES: hypothetical protein [Pseudomonas]|uniref:Fap n=1 Tax=Pseudomonas poae TaxID=200451 RepID=A0A7Z1K6F9_9PSED|nr:MULTISPECIES: hypothetical protein [Pseudomonas]KAA8553410.1 hypothetical protein FX984_00019 [Pseudomonas marginalis]PFG72086.1 hypothetical protein DM05_2467 [Pseudomonas poae]TWR66417.1 hypothetical protein FIV40_25240 [Pseudomonas marginalis]SCX29052.1 hypothetical protein SAMN03159437_03207 [Pseudomonas sp. NFACC25]SMF59353.1 hypothetical protein SAMN05660912_04745 [Pseudomonas sp. LAMO17WK12:I1]